MGVRPKSIHALPLVCSGSPALALVCYLSKTKIDTFFFTCCHTKEIRPATYRQFWQNCLKTIVFCDVGFIVNRPFKKLKQENKSERRKSVVCFVKGGGDKHFGSFSRESIVFSTLSCNISLNWLEFVKICQKIFFSKIFFQFQRSTMW